MLDVLHSINFLNVGYAVRTEEKRLKEVIEKIHDLQIIESWDAKRKVQLT